GRGPCAMQPLNVRPAAGRRVALTPYSIGVAGAVLVMALAGGQARAQEVAREASDDAWTVLWPIYLWASGIDGRVGVGGNVIDVDIGFSDVVEHLDGAVFLPLELRKGRWAAVLEVIAIRLGDQRGRPAALAPEHDHRPPPRGPGPSRADAGHGRAVG